MFNADSPLTCMLFLKTTVEPVDDALSVGAVLLRLHAHVPKYRSSLRHASARGTCTECGISKVLIAKPVHLSEVILMEPLKAFILSCAVALDVNSFEYHFVDGLGMDA